MAGLQSPGLVSHRTSGEFVGTSVLEVVVPAASDVDLQDQFSAWDGDIPEDSTSIVPFVEQRPFLLLDELLTAYAVLRIQALDETELKIYLSRLSLSIEARAVGQQIIKPADGSHPPQVKEASEVLASETVNISDDPLICATEIQAEDDSGPTQYIYIFWKVSIPLGRPRLRLQKLAIYFSPLASLNPIPMSLSMDDEYMPSQLPTAVNLLQPFATDPALEGIHPQLLASRITQATSNAPRLAQLSRPIRSRARKLFRAAPAFLWRIRFLRFPGLSEKDAILACFDIETTNFAGCDVTVDNITLKLSSGSWEPVTASLPQRCQPGEQLSLVYKLAAPAVFDKTMDTAPGSRTLTISLFSSVLVSETCTPKVRIKWKTALELPPSRPNSMLPPLSAAPMEAVGPDSLLMTGEVAEVVTGPAIADGVSVTISAPKTVVVQRVFRWEIMVINRSDKVQRFAIVPLARRFGETFGSNARPSSSGSLDRCKSLANPVVDGNVVYSLQKTGMAEATDLICLTPDVRIGSLAPSACYSSEVEFMPLSTGVLRLDAIRLIDLTSQLTVDIRQLPDIVSLAS